MKLRFLILILIISCTGYNEEPSRHERIAATISDSYNSGGYVPLVSDIDPGLEIDDAYDIQKHFVKTILKKDKIAGYKTGLASKKAQSNFFVDSPISGVLFQSGMNADNSVINISDYFTMLVETELGYKIAERITVPIKSADELNEKISYILPVIELPDVRFAENKYSKLKDVVAANICSANFITGKEFEFKDFISESIDISLKLNDKEINSVSISDSMEYQKELLVWLINKQLENGWEIEPGQLLITGAMEKINIGRVGNYEADYGPLGTVNFMVR
jgi:2-keto-4-pentenoate hydratase